MQRINISLSNIRNCDEHGSSGLLPCAWPGCAHGLNDTEFEEEPFIQDKVPTTYKRREWQSPLGGQYYSWESSDMPNWFFAPQTFWNEARRHKLISTSSPKVLYHYTSLEGFMGIINSRAVWMTEFAYLNDRKEVSHGLELLLETVNSILKSEQNTDVRDLLTTWSESLAETPNRVCITSFSTDADSLSQWRAYGPIAVGFPVRPLSLHVDQARLQQVEYNPETQSKLVQIYIYHLIAAYVADLQDGHLEQVPDLYQKSDRLLELAVFFKDPAFRTENEYRLAYIDNPDVLQAFDIASPPKSFRVANGRIVPYVPSTEVLPSERRNFELEISEIVLGPESDNLLERGVREFLNAKGLANVEVRKSAVPFRS